jgi:hypothetical protein
MILLSCAGVSRFDIMRAADEFLPAVAEVVRLKTLF